MKVFYNEWDDYAASWLEKLGDNNHIPNGTVSRKSITDHSPHDFDGYDQCHFFAGIGGWPLALRLAGYENLPCWTGSPPCQPFSLAGKKLGVNDDRHLAPTWIKLIRAQKPTIIFGEQVASAIAHGWVDELKSNLETEGYAFGFSVLSGRVASAPHERKRIFFGAIKVADAHKMYGKGEQHWKFGEQKGVETCACTVRSSDIGRMLGQWEDCEIQTSEYDGKNRICKPGIPLLVNGIPGTMGGISGYGNAIIPQVAAFFIENFMGAVEDMLND